MAAAQAQARGKVRFFTTPYCLFPLLSPRRADALAKALGKRPLTRALVFGIGKSKGPYYSRRRKASSARIGPLPVREKMLRRIAALIRRHWQLRGRMYATPMQYVVYKKGDRFDWHVDSPHHKYLDGRGKTDRLLTAVLLLSSPRSFRGGELQLRDFHGGLHKITLRQGELIVFPSEYTHRATRITSGARHILVLWIRGLPMRQQT